MRQIRLLHVEDNRMQQRLIAHHLAGLAEYEFAITPVASEDEAVQGFQTGGVEMVILDYHLSQGNGLSCLRRLRALDPLVPIIAVSGKASPEVAAELLREGADDYINKNDLTSEALTRGVRTALVRADTWRKRAGKPPEERCPELCLHVCQAYLAGAGPELLNRLDDLERAARLAQLDESQLRELFETTGQHPHLAHIASIASLLRPMWLEMRHRLFEQ
jgi:CheY-like chemotaxis protein